ncbi:MAG: guanylate kinase [Peptococcaceae bacterium]|nr:guanylate kinase [Peptococcaceae bacterium]
MTERQPGTPGQGLLVLISGPSGSGKGTVCGLLIKNCPDLNLRLSVSATTRPPRPGEVNGRDYFFMSRREFEKLAAEGGFLEWAPIYGNLYGTPAGPVREALGRGENVILEIDVQGGLQVKELFPDAVLIFLIPPSREALRRRLSGRGTDSPDEIEKRMLWVDTELGYMSRYDYILVNDRLEETVSRVRCILEAERSRARRFRLPGGWINPGNGN